MKELLDYFKFNWPAFGGGGKHRDLFHYWLRNCLHDRLKQPVILSLHSTIVHEPFHCTEHNRIFRGHHVNQLLTHSRNVHGESGEKQVSVLWKRKPLPTTK